MRSKFLILLLMLSAIAHGGEQLKPGDSFPAFQAMDQHDVMYTFAPGPAAVLITFDMATGKRMNRFIASQDEDYLVEHEIVYISNIHGMPGIGRMFALPKMKRYPHRIILATEKDQLVHFPRKDDQVTILRLSRDGVIQSIDFWGPAGDFPEI
jgi:hypothetical protein